MYAVAAVAAAAAAYNLFQLPPSIAYTMPYLLTYSCSHIYSSTICASSI